MDIKEYCRHKAAPPGSNFYYSTLFLTKKLKEHLYALHSFNVEINHVIEECTDPGVARIKLYWWHEEIERSCAGNARHPVGKSLTNLIKYHYFPEEKFHQLIDHVETRPSYQQPDNYNDLISFLKQGPGLFWQLSAELCGYQDPSTLKIVDDIGCSISLFEIIQNTHNEAIRGRVLLPKEEMTDTGIKLNNFINLADTRTRKFFAQQFQRLTDILNNSYINFPQCDRQSQLSCLIMNRIVLQTCKEIVLDDYSLDSYKITLTPLRKLWIAWLTKQKSK